MSHVRCITMLTLVIVLMVSLQGSAQADSREILTNRIAAAVNASDAEKVDLLSGIIIEYEYELDIRDARLEQLSAMYDAGQQSWWEKVWDHDILKLGAFVAGVYLGRDMVKVK